jgi:hypothetical protein
MRIEVGKTHYFEGHKFRLDMDPVPPKPIPGGTAMHEAMHIVPAIENGTGVESATIVPGAGYSGLTKLSRPDIVAAMGPHSMGASGTGYDVYIAGLMGNAGGAESAARGIINSNMDKVRAVASKLEEVKTLTSVDIFRAIDEVDHPKPQPATLFIENENGDQSKKRVVVRDNILIEKVDLIEIFSTKKPIN